MVFKSKVGSLAVRNKLLRKLCFRSGIILTNHHCARESITEVTGKEEDLLEEGFLAATAVEERKVPNLYVEQLSKFQM